MSKGMFLTSNTVLLDSNLPRVDFNRTSKPDSDKEYTQDNPVTEGIDLGADSSSVDALGMRKLESLTSGASQINRTKNCSQELGSIELNGEIETSRTQRRVEHGAEDDFSDPHTAFLPKMSPMNFSKGV